MPGFRVFDKGERAQEASYFGAYVKERRSFVHLTQTELAEKLGVTQGFIQGIEAGRKRIPLDKMEAYAAAVSTPISELYFNHIRYHDPDIFQFLTSKQGHQDL